MEELALEELELEVEELALEELELEELELVDWVSTYVPGLTKGIFFRQVQASYGAYWP